MTGNTLSIVSNRISHVFGLSGPSMGTVRPWTAEAVARKIVKGIDRRRFEIYFGATLYLLGRFGPAVRPLIDWWFDRAIARNRAG